MDNFHGKFPIWATMRAMTVTSTVDRRPRAFWADLRFFLGVLLVLASIAGVWFVVTASRQTLPVLAAARTLVPGEPITSADVKVVEVALGAVDVAYLPESKLGDSMVATRTIEAGELLPRTAIGNASSATTTSIVLNSTVDVPESVVHGARVEVWQAPLVERGIYDVPRILIADATVVDVTRDDSLVGGGVASLELVIDRAEVSDTLAAIAAGAALSVIPLAGQAL